MHWMLECYRDAWLGGRSIEDWPRLPGIKSWLSGERFAAQPPNPIVLYWDPNDERGPAQPLYKARIPMMTRAVHETLQRAGVDNLDVYPVEVHSHSSPDVDRSYVAFNVLGLVAAADMSASVIVEDGSPNLIAVPFESVVIDDRAARGLPLFRLAENVSAIVVHERIKRILEASHPGLAFVKPEKWVG